MEKGRANCHLKCLGGGFTGIPHKMLSTFKNIYKYLHENSEVRGRLNLNAKKGTIFSLIIFLSLFIYFEWGKGRERMRENPKQAPSCQPRAWCGAQTHEPWDHDLSPNKEWEAWLSPPGAPTSSALIGGFGIPYLVIIDQTHKRKHLRPQKI